MVVAGAWPAVALLGGAWWGTSFGVPDGPVHAAPVLVVLVILTGVCWWRHRSWATLITLVAAYGLAGLLLAGTAASAALDSPLRAVLERAFGGFDLAGAGPPGPHPPLMLRAVITDDAALAEGFVRVRVRAVAIRIGGRWHGAGGGVSMAVSGSEAARRFEDWRAGRRIEASVTFRRPERYFNPGFADGERALALDGTTLFASVKSGLLVTVVAPGSMFDELASSARACVRQAVRRWVGRHDATSAAVATAVLIGDRTALDPVVVTRLQEAGTFHVMAISGGNIAVLTAMLLGGLTVVGARGPLRFVLAAGLLAVYARLVTAGPSVWRAAVMAGAYLLARAIDQRMPPWQALAVAGAAIVVGWPLAIRNVGLVLTFGAAAGLLECARAMRGWDAARGPAPDRGRDVRGGWRSWSLGAASALHRGWCAARAAVMTTAAVEAVLLPVGASAFSRITLAGLILNLAAVPLMAVVQVAGMLVVALDAFPWPASACGWVAHAAVTALTRSAGLVEVAPWLTRRVPPPPVALVAAYYGLLLGWRAAPAGVWRRASGCAAAVAAIAMALGRPVPAPAPERQADALRWTILDVGQGEAMLLEFPEGRRLLVDAGGQLRPGANDLGARVVSPALWALGVRRLHGAVLTHGDLDHAGGMRAIVEDFRPARLWEGIPVPRHAPTKALRREAARHGVPHAELHEGASWRWGGVTVRVLHPPSPDWERRTPRNDDSVVLELVYGAVAVLLTGDVSGEVEASLAGRLTNAPIRILKVAHHGSRSASFDRLLDAWRPQAAVVSSGRGNRFGHPAPEVLARFATRRIPVWRTDQHGAITVDIVRDGVRVRGWEGPP